LLNEKLQIVIHFAPKIAETLYFLTALRWRSEKMVSLLLCRSVWIIWKQFRLVSTILFAIMSWLAGKITIYS
jgi:hypothetical protein